MSHRRLSLSSDSRISLFPLRGTTARILVQVCGMRTDAETAESGSRRFNSGYILAHDGQRAAAPGMVVSAAAETFRADSPSFPQGSQRAVCHGAVAQFHPVEGILVVAHQAEGLQDVFLHIRAGMILLAEEGAQCRIERVGQCTRNHGKGLRAVVGQTLVRG